MKTIGPTSRTFEHGFRTTLKKFESDQNERPTRKFYYLRLMQVSIRHDYYNRSHDECPDFAIYPTASSAALMQSLGLIFKDEGTGFSILYDVRRQDNLLQYLKRQEWPEGSNHCWTRLSFVLSLTNPYFLNFTDIPIETNPVTANFYFTNREARRYPGGEIILNPGHRLESLPVVPVQLGLEVTDEVREVEVQSVAQVYERSKEAVICKPRCVPDALLKEKNAASITCQEARKKCKGPHEERKSHTHEKCSCTNKLYLDFSSVPEDKYTIKKIYYSSSTPIADEAEVLYTESYPMPLCFMDLYFTSPAGERPKLFPIQNLFDDNPKVEPVSYELRFERRSTYWNYFIVPQSDESVDHWTIEGEPGIHFEGPCTVYLPNGQRAYRFISKKPLPFMQQSPFRFRLVEIVPGAQINTIMKSLPVASAEQVLQDEVAACLSLDGSIYPGAKGECRKLKGHICRCVCADMRITDCLKHIKRICADPQSPECLKLRNRCSRIYSDTFVYV